MHQASSGFTAKTKDTLTTCRHCGSDACYQYQDARHIRWQCMDCGFYTNTYMLRNTQLVNHLIETSPDLFTDISEYDAEGFYWTPMIVNKPGIGIISPMGTSAQDWAWVFIPEVQIPYEERHKYPIKSKPGEFHETKADMTKMQKYGVADFILALKDANLLNVEL